MQNPAQTVSKGCIMTRRNIDFASYPRKDHFEHFMAMENPFANVTVRVDITDWIHWLKEKEYPFFLTFQYAVSHAVNRIPEMRQRIYEGSILEYDFTDPSWTVPAPDGTYRYCSVNADQPLEAYLEEGKRKQAEAALSEGLTEEGDVLGLLFTTCLPWIDFSSVVMPYHDRTFSNTSVAWGKYTRETYPALEDGKLAEKEKVTIPVQIMVNHALVDGRHIAAFFENLDKELKRMTEGAI